MPAILPFPSLYRRQPHATALGVLCAWSALSACSAGPEAEGTPSFNTPPGGSAGSTGAVGSAGTPSANVGGSSGATGTTGPGEQNTGNQTPLVPGNSGGSAGAPAAGAAGSPAGAAGSGVVNAGGAGGAPLTPPSNATPEQITAFFESLPCGARYSALGDGGWQFCLRLSDGGAACARGTAEFTRVAFAGGAAVTNVAQVSGQRDSGVGVVTTAGALHIGGVTSISATPLIASGVVNYSGGFHASVALVSEGDGFGVLSWTDNGTPTAVTLPDGAEPIQVSANYGLACALSTAGDAYCWNAGGNHSLQQLTDAPTRMAIARPLQMLSVGQNSVCGVSFDGTLECLAAWYDSPFLPTEGSAPNFQVRTTSFPSVREVHVGFGQGIVVRGDGTAVYLPGGVSPPADNPGQAFTGVANIVAAGGDRGSACVQTQAGAVFCRVGAGISQATLAGSPLVAQAATCPL